MQHLCAAFLFCFFSCASVFSQGSGTLQCDPDMEHVPAWTEPDSAYIVEQLNCGQTISIAKSEGGYFKVQLGERVGYVNAKFVRLDEVGEWPKTERVDQVIKSQPPSSSTGAAGKTAGTSASDRNRNRQYRGVVAFDISHIRYEEPSLTMKESGMMYGVSGEFTEHRRNFMYRLDARFSLGDVDYASPSGEFDNIRDYQFETRYSFGYSLKNSEKGRLTPFVGLGFRYLHDNLDSAGPGGYDRKSKYLYTPIGMEGLVRLRGGWSLGASGEYNLFWHGWQNSEIGDVCLGCNTLKNNQKDGWGARGTVRIIKNLGKVDFSVEPFFRYWDIDTSDLQFITFQEKPVSVGWEPANTSREWGTRLGISF